MIDLLRELWEVLPASLFIIVLLHFLVLQKIESNKIRIVILLVVCIGLLILWQFGAEDALFIAILTFIIESGYIFIVQRIAQVTRNDDIIYVQSVIDNTEETLESYVKKRIIDITIEIEKNTFDYELFYDRAFLLSSIGDNNRALEDINLYIENIKDSSEAYVMRGYIKSDLGKSMDACEDYTEALMLSPEDYTIYFLRAEEKERMGDLIGALKDYEISLAKCPDSYQTSVEKDEEILHKDEIEEKFNHVKKQLMK